MKAHGMIPDVFSYSSLIRGFCLGGKWEETKRLFNETVDQSVQPNMVTSQERLSRLRSC